MLSIGILTTLLPAPSWKTVWQYCGKEKYGGDIAHAVGALRTNFSDLKRAIIAAEDSKFLEHEGFDFDAIQNAYQKNLKKRQLVAGGSTISQQPAKNLFLSSEKTLWRKLQEAVITLMLEKVMSKRRILEIYLNVIEWGNDSVRGGGRHSPTITAFPLLLLLRNKLLGSRPWFPTLAFTINTVIRPGCRRKP